ncbi:hypothetical protein JCM19039_2323 [Geomicrobium sp. JCM 19039]|nr:hypothetical protein JCM19039_2323 [Geomicrobium sp. JCM 19039]
MTVLNIILNISQNESINIQSIMPFTLIGLGIGFALALLRFIIKGDLWEKN